MPPEYHPIETLLGRIDAPAGPACRRLLDAHRARFVTAPGSTHNHQAWPGGYLDHVVEAMNVAVLLYDALSAARPLPFSCSDALLVVFLHDLEKPWKYEMGEDGHLRHREGQRTKESHHAARLERLEAYGIRLTPEQDNGVRYIEGEIGDYTNRARRMGPLAAFCHAADVTSARLWFDHPLPHDDPWPGARRVAHPGPEGTSAEKGSDP